MRKSLGIAVSLAAVAGITAVEFAWLGVNSATASFSYLLLVLALATRVGLTESLVASFASVLCYNYFFLPPIGNFTIADPENWVALFAFLITSITTSHLSAKARRQTEEARARQLELERLHEFTTALMIGDPERSILSQIAKQISRVFESPSAALYDLDSNTFCLAGIPNPALSEALLRQATLGNAIRRVDDGTVIVPVTLGGSAKGSLGITGPNTLSDVALRALAQAAAIAIERARTQEAASRADATMRHEELKSTLLDALAHEFKTPLTSIRAATTALLGRPGGSAAEREFLTIADEEADRLNRLVNEAIEATRVSSGDLQLHRELSNASELIFRALDELRAFCEGREIEVDAGVGLPKLDIDRNLAGLALRQLINNALKYAPTSSPIRIGARGIPGFVEFRVKNDGPGIPPEEQKAIFEKFYRRQEARQRIPGTGLGLTIARGIVEAHGGKISVESEPGRGVTFVFTLPAVGAQ
jgi:two-component system, OmpR family, sensor histidine kinase KdpD